MSDSIWTDAKAVSKDALLDRPRPSLPLYGIALASEQAGAVTTATKKYADFLAAWKSADAQLPQLAHARAFLAAHKAVAANKLPTVLTRIPLVRKHTQGLLPGRAVLPASPVRPRVIWIDAWTRTRQRSRRAQFQTRPNPPNV